MIKFCRHAPFVEKIAKRPNDTVDEENPVILLGHGRFGQQINSMLVFVWFHTTVIDNHAEMVEGLTKYGIKTYYGDATRPELLIQLVYTS